MLTDDQLREALLGVLTAKGWTELEWKGERLWGFYNSATRRYGKAHQRPSKNGVKRLALRYDLDLNAIVEEVGRLEDWEKRVWYKFLCEQFTIAHEPHDMAQAPASGRLWALWQTIQQGERS